MKSRLKFYLLGFFFPLILTACSSATSNNPNEVLRNFFEHLTKKDIDGASKYVTSDSKPTLQMMKKGLEMADKMKDSLPQNNPLKDFENITFEPARIMGDSAFILVKSNNREHPEAEFKLIKESNGWKVDFTMSTLIRMGAKTVQEQDLSLGDISNLNTEKVEKGMEKADSILKNIAPDILEDIQKKLENLK